MAAGSSLRRRCRLLPWTPHQGIARQRSPAAFLLLLSISLASASWHRNRGFRSQLLTTPTTCTSRCVAVSILVILTSTLLTITEAVRKKMLPFIGDTSSATGILADSYLSFVLKFLNSDYTSLTNFAWEMKKKESVEKESSCTSPRCLNPRYINKPFGSFGMTESGNSVTAHITALLRHPDLFLP